VRMVSGEVDMATAELLAFGSLMLPFHPDDPIGRIKREERRSSLSDTTDAIHRSRPEFLVEYQVIAFPSPFSPSSPFAPPAPSSLFPDVQKLM
jgi:hypothetical protein